MAVGDSSEESDHDRERERKSKKRKGAGILPTAGFLLNAQKDDLPTKGDEFNDFFWDLLVKYACSAMVALTLLDILSSIRGDSVQCMTPSNFTRDQGAFVNNYCTQYTPPTDFFAFYLIAQATLIFGVHFLWYSWFSGKFCYFLALATSLERHRESKTGDYSLENFVIARALLTSFGRSKSIHRLYIAKLVVQFLVSGFSIWFNFDHNIFGNYNPSFICPDNSTEIPTTWPIGSYRIPCVLTSLVLLVAVRWLNVILLCGIVLAVLYGFMWCLWDHKSRLNWAMVARFSFDSGLPPSSYVPKDFRLRYSNPRYICKYRMRNDFDFLFLKLFREDAGHAQVLREVLIDDYISKDWKRQFEELSLRRRVDKRQIVELNRKSNKKTKKIQEEVKFTFDERVTNRAKPDKGLGNTLQSVLCNIVTANVLGLKNLNAIDIAFGTTGYKLQLAAKATRVVAVDLNPYFLNKEECFHESRYAAGLINFRTSVNIFSEEKATIKKFREQLAKVYYKNDPVPDFDAGPIVQSARPKFPPANVVVVGPIPVDDGLSGTNGGDSRTNAVHWLLDSLRQYNLLQLKSYLITVKPVVIEGHDVSKEFVDFEPLDQLRSPIATYRSSKMNKFKICPSGLNTEQCEALDIDRVEQLPVQDDDPHVEIRCGWSNCYFKIQVYTLGIVGAESSM